VEKADLSKCYQNPKRKFEVTTHFSEIIELNVGKKLPYRICILTLFSELWLLNYLRKMIPITLAKIYFFPLVITFAKIHLY